MGAHKKESIIMVMKKTRSDDEDDDDVDVKFTNVKFSLN